MDGALGSEESPGEVASQAGKQKKEEGEEEEKNGHAEREESAEEEEEEDRWKRKRKRKRKVEALPRPCPPPSWSPFRLNEAFDALAGNLRRLSKCLPLDITAVTCVSPAIRGADVAPVLPVSAALDRLGSALPAAVAPIEVVLSLEISGKWPGELAALRQAKLLFMNRLKAFLLRDADPRLRSCRLDAAGRLLVYQGGFLFRLTLAVPKEVLLLSEVTDSLGQRHKVDSPEARELERAILHLPALCGRLKALGGRFPGLLHTIRLVRRWLAAQGMSASLEWPAVELLCAAVCLNPSLLGASSAPA